MKPFGDHGLSLLHSCYDRVPFPVGQPLYVPDAYMADLLNQSHVNAGRYLIYCWKKEQMQEMKNAYSKHELVHFQSRSCS